jgi:cell division septation protein DedD
MAAPAQSDAALPPRLRERLERELEREESGGSPVRNVLIAVSVVATLGMMLILMQRFGAIDLPFLRSAAGERVQSTQTGAAGPEGSVVPPVVQDEATAALIDSLKREAEMARQTAEPTATVPVPTAAPTRPAAAQPRETFQPNPSTPTPNEPAPAAPAPTSEAGSFYGVQVSQFGDAARANAEKDRVARTTGVRTQVIPVTEAGVTLYRVVVGPWSSAADADQAMNALLENGSINSGRVVTVPKR